MSSASHAVLLAVRERYERLTLEIPQVHRRTVEALTQYERAVQAEDAFKKELAELGEFLEREGEPATNHRDMTGVTATANMQILLRAKSILSDGTPRKTADLYNALLQQGQVFTAQNPMQRLSQLLSGSSWFVSDRARGWMLTKSENPAGAGFSGATQSRTDTEGKEEA
jgi:hypothetical protein